MSLFDDDKDLNKEIKESQKLIQKELKEKEKQSLKKEIEDVKSIDDDYDFEDFLNNLDNDPDELEEEDELKNLWDEISKEKESIDKEIKETVEARRIADEEDMKTALEREAQDLEDYKRAIENREIRKRKQKLDNINQKILYNADTPFSLSGEIDNLIDKVVAVVDKNGDVPHYYCFYHSLGRTGKDEYLNNPNFPAISCLYSNVDTKTGKLLEESSNERYFEDDVIDFLNSLDGNVYSVYISENTFDRGSEFLDKESIMSVIFPDTREEYMEMIKKDARLEQEAETNGESEDIDFSYFMDNGIDL